MKRVVGFTGFMETLVSTSNLHAELMMLLHGLSPTWEKGVRNLICYSDSLHSVSMILNPANP